MIGLRGDLHIHTICSDGRSGAEEIVYEALKKSIRILAATDHDTFKGYYLLKRYLENKSISIVLVPGNEVRSDLGDLVILCGEPLDDASIPRRALELVDYAHQNNCVVYAPHPYDPMRLGVGDHVRTLKIDAIEIFNATAPPWSNKKASKTADLLGVTRLANSDAHVPEFVGSAHNIIYVNDLSVEEVLESILRGRVDPVPKRPSIKAYIKDLYHSLELRLKKKSSNC